MLSWGFPDLFSRWRNNHAKWEEEQIDKGLETIAAQGDEPTTQQSPPGLPTAATPEKPVRILMEA